MDLWILLISSMDSNWARLVFLDRRADPALMGVITALVFIMVECRGLLFR